jgi:Fe-S-cluster containining protein
VRNRRSRGRTAGGAAEAGSAPRTRRRGDLRRRWPASECSCDLCRQACLNSPGWFLPEEIAPLAQHLGLRVSELFRRRLAVSETVTPEGGRWLGVMPHKLRDGKGPGGRWTLAELQRPGRCTFYDRGRCTIHPWRPFECSRMHHEHSSAKTARLRSDVTARWTDARLAPFLELIATTASRTRGRRRR